MIVFVPFVFFRSMILLTAGNNSFSRVKSPYEIRPESKQKKLQNTYLERTVLRKDLGGLTEVGSGVRLRTVLQ